MAIITSARNVQNILTRDEIADGIDDYNFYVQDEIDGALWEESMSEMEALMDEWYGKPREFTLGFYNFKIAGGDKVLPIYRQFDNCLLTYEQACDCIADVMYDLIDACEENPNVDGVDFDLSEDEAVVNIYMDSEVHSAVIWVLDVSSSEMPRPVDVINNDAYWEDPVFAMSITESLVDLLKQEERLLYEFQEAELDYQWWNKEKHHYWYLSEKDIAEGDEQRSAAWRRASSRLAKVRRKINCKMVWH